MVPSDDEDDEDDEVASLMGLYQTEIEDNNGHESDDSHAGCRAFVESESTVLREPT